MDMKKMWLIFIREWICVSSFKIFWAKLENLVADHIIYQQRCSTLADLGCLLSLHSAGAVVFLAWFQQPVRAKPNYKIGTPFGGVCTATFGVWVGDHPTQTICVDQFSEISPCNWVDGLYLRGAAPHGVGFV